MLRSETAAAAAKKLKLSLFIFLGGWGGYNSFMEYEFYKISMLHDHTAEPCRHTISPFHFYGFIHTVHLRAVIFGVTFECQPVTRMSSPFFPVTGEERTPRKQDIVGVHFRKKKLSATLYSSLWQSHWADIMCELLAPFKSTSLFHHSTLYGDV